MAKWLTEAESMADIWEGKCTITPLVECKDCKYYVPSAYSVHGAGFCKAIGRLTYPKPDDFCSRGERKVEE